MSGRSTELNKSTIAPPERVAPSEFLFVGFVTFCKILPIPHPNMKFLRYLL